MCGRLACDDTRPPADAVPWFDSVLVRAQPTAPFIRNGQRVGSSTNRMYELENDAEGLAYLQYGELRANYLEVLGVMNASLEGGVEPRRLLGIDVPRAEACACARVPTRQLGPAERCVSVRAHCWQRHGTLLTSPRSNQATRLLRLRASVPSSCSNHHRRQPRTVRPVALRAVAVRAGPASRRSDRSLRARTDPDQQLVASIRLLVQVRCRVWRGCGTKSGAVSGGEMPAR
jgi:hypothetical protein